MTIRQAVRLGILAGAALLSVASVAQQQPGQAGGAGGGAADSTYCTQACKHYYACKGTIQDQTTFAGCVQECQQAGIDPQQTYKFTQMSCPDAIAVVEGGGQQGGATGGNSGNSGGSVTTSCPGTVNVLGSWGHGGGQMYEITFYRNGHIVERIHNINMGVSEAAGTFTITSCPSIDIVMSDGTRRQFVATDRNISEVGYNTPYGKCPDEGCF